MMQWYSLLIALNRAGNGFKKLRFLKGFYFLKPKKPKSPKFRFLRFFGEILYRF